MDKEYQNIRYEDAFDIRLENKKGEPTSFVLENVHIIKIDMDDDFIVIHFRHHFDDGRIKAVYIPKVRGGKLIID